MAGFQSLGVSSFFFFSIYSVLTYFLYPCQGGYGFLRFALALDFHKIVKSFQNFVSTISEDFRGFSKIRERKLHCGLNIYI